MLSQRSISAPEHPYTDRDVREDPVLTDFAVAYAQAYQGSFDPMREAQRELLDEGGLSTRTARIVLNCARHDQRVQDRLPIPRPAALPDAGVQAPVLSLVPPLPPLPPLPELPPRTHEKVMRRYEVEVRLPVVVRAPFVVGRAARYVHRAVADSTSNEAVWRIKGARKPRNRGFAGTVLLAGPPEREFVSLSVKTLCKYPSVLHEAQLVSLPHLGEVLDTPRWSVNSSPKDAQPPSMCPRCAVVALG